MGEAGGGKGLAADEEPVAPLSVAIPGIFKPGIATLIRLPLTCILRHCRKFALAERRLAR